MDAAADAVSISPVSADPSAPQPNASEEAGLPMVAEPGSVDAGENRGTVDTNGGGVISSGDLQGYSVKGV
jgi:hypothetical protein